MDCKTLEQALEKTLERLTAKGSEAKKAEEFRDTASCLLYTAKNHGNGALQKALETTLKRLDERAKKDDSDP